MDKTLPGSTALMDIPALLNAGGALGAPKYHPGYKPVIIVPDGYRAEPLEFEQPKPLKDYIDQQVTLNDLDSFVAYVKRYTSSTTLIFASITPDGATFTAVFDYHAARSEGDAAVTATAIDGAATQARRTAHQATYPCPRSHEWGQWFGKNRVAFKQEEFANFIDNNIPDIVAPDSGQLLELVLNFEMKANVDFSSEITRQSGARSLRFTETIEASGGGGSTAGAIKVPEDITLSIPVFYGGKPFEIKAKLFYRAPGGKLSISYEMRRPHEVVDKAVKDIVKDITTATGLTPLVGAPRLD